jgi:hypothetical protein
MQALYLPATFGTEAVVQGDGSSTLCACPFLFFFQKILFSTDSLHPGGVLDQTDLISLSITFIQPFDDSTGKG